MDKYRVFDEIISLNLVNCEEASVEALLVAIPHTKAGADILFASDASPYPDANVDKVIELLRGKGIHFNAMIIGDCSMQDSWNNLPYIKWVGNQNTLLTRHNVYRKNAVH